MTRRALKRLAVSGGVALAVGALLTMAYWLTFFSTAQVQSTDFLFESQRVSRHPRGDRRGHPRNAGKALVYRFLDVVEVKGRNEPLVVYEVVGRAGQLDPAKASALEAFQQGTQLHRTRRWAETAMLFRDLQEYGDDGPSALYPRRSCALLKSPPPAEWDGVYVAETKYRPLKPRPAEPAGGRMRSPRLGEYAAAPVHRGPTA